MMPVRKNQNWLPSIFNDFFGNEWVDKSNVTAPAVNIVETETDFQVEVAAPGMTKEDFRVDINEDNELIVTMEKKNEQQTGSRMAPSQTAKSSLSKDSRKTTPGSSHDMPEDAQQEDKARTENTGHGKPGQDAVATCDGAHKADRRRTGTYLRREFSYSRFQQRLILPDNVMKEKITARVENGVLTIEIPKKQAQTTAAARRIEIE